MFGHQNHPLPPISRQNVARNGMYGVNRCRCCSVPPKAKGLMGEWNFYVNSYIIMVIFMPSIVTINEMMLLKF